MKDFILCAAIKYNGLIIPGHRHGDCYSLLEGLIGKISTDKLPGRNKQGFLTSKNRYVSREEAWEIAKENNQIMFGLKACDFDVEIQGIDYTGVHTPILISENLY